MAKNNVYFPLSETEILKNKLSGMTVNERLLETKQLEIFDLAIQAKDKVKVLTILQSVFVDEPDLNTLYTST